MISYFYIFWFSSPFSMKFQTYIVSYYSLQNECIQGVYWNRPVCLSVRMYLGAILESACLSVCPFVHLCSKYYFLSKCLWGYQVTFSDSSSFTSCPILSVLARRGLFRFLLNFKNHSSSN